MISRTGIFQECPITFRDIAQAKQVLIERLKAIYHTRISYPELNQPKQERTSSSDRNVSQSSPETEKGPNDSQLDVKGRYLTGKEKTRPSN